MLEASGFVTRVKTGATATEPDFANSSKEGIVHIATHGFFVADPKENQTSVFSIPLYNVNENVLLRSGLLFAGAGNSTDRAVGGSSNGVLTSYDVMNLDMSKTDIVVLSACETGLGDNMAGEGVFGLQRAFQIAGAKSVVMSLWKVDDEATKELMVNFYRNWINSGNVDDAFVLAQKAVRNKFPHPYYWGSFVLMRN
jgi:CHAT domain-containing protein